MTREEAIKILSREKECVQQALQRCADGSGYVSPDGMIRAADYVEACSVALAALRAQQEPEDPKPLTLDELRQMDGEPVWVTGPAPLWALVKVTGDAVAIVSNDPEIAKAEQWIKHIGRIYRHKPKEEV